MVTRRRLLLLLVSCCLLVVTGVAAGTPPSPGPGYDGPPAPPGGGSGDPGNPPATPDPPDPSPGTPAPPAGTNATPANPFDQPNATWDGSFNNSSAEAPGSGPGLFGYSPVDFIGSSLEWLAKSALEATTDQIDWINTVISGMPAPGEPSDPSTWVNPQNGLWPGVWTATQWSLSFATLLLLGGGMAAFLSSDAYVRRRRLVRVGLSLVAIAGTWFFAPMGLHFGSAVGQAFAPTGAEFLASPGDFAKLGVGFILAVALALISSAIILIGLFVLAAQYFLAHAVVFFWPIAWGLRCFDGFPKSIGDFAIYLYGALIALNIGQAMLLRLVFELPWMTGGAVGSLMGFLGTAAGLAFALIWFPKVMLEQVTAGSAVGLGVSEGSKRAGQATTAAREKVGNVRERYLDSSRGSRSHDGASENSQSGGPSRTPSLRRSGRRPMARADGGGGSDAPPNPYYRDSEFRAARDRRETDSIQRNAK